MKKDSPSYFDPESKYENQRLVTLFLLYNFDSESTLKQCLNSFFPSTLRQINNFKDVNQILVNSCPDKNDFGKTRVTPQAFANRSLEVAALPTTCLQEKTKSAFLLKHDHGVKRVNTPVFANCPLEVAALPTTCLQEKTKSSLLRKEEPGIQCKSILPVVAHASTNAKEIKRNFLHTEMKDGCVNNPYELKLANRSLKINTFIGLNNEDAYFTNKTREIPAKHLSFQNNDRSEKDVFFVENLPETNLNNRHDFLKSNVEQNEDMHFVEHAFEQNSEDNMQFVGNNIGGNVLHNLSDNTPHFTKDSRKVPMLNTKELLKQNCISVYLSDSSISDGKQTCSNNYDEHAIFKLKENRDFSSIYLQGKMASSVNDSLSCSSVHKSPKQLENHEYFDYFHDAQTEHLVSDTWKKRRSPRSLSKEAYYKIKRQKQLANDTHSSLTEGKENEQRTDDMYSSLLHEKGNEQLGNINSSFLRLKETEHPSNDIDSPLAVIKENGGVEQKFICSQSDLFKKKDDYANSKNSSLLHNGHSTILESDRTVSHEPKNLLKLQLSNENGSKSTFVLSANEDINDSSKGTVHETADEHQGKITSENLCMSKLAYETNNANETTYHKPNENIPLWETHSKRVDNFPPLNIKQEPPDDDEGNTSNAFIRKSSLCEEKRHDDADKNVNFNDNLHLDYQSFLSELNASNIPIPTNINEDDLHPKHQETS